MRRDVFQSCSLAAFPDDVPDDILRDPGAPDLAASGHSSKYLASINSRGRNPIIQRLLSPLWDGHGTDVTAFADQIDNSPVSLPRLDVVQFDSGQLRSSQTTPEEHRQHRTVPFGSEGIAAGAPQHG